MKFLILCLILTCSFAAMAGTEITLDPGARATINAGDSVTVQCSGQSTGGNSRAECFITPMGKKRPDGHECRGSYFCAEIYQFGVSAGYTEKQYSQDAAAWCREKLAGK